MLVPAKPDVILAVPRFGAVELRLVQLKTFEGPPMLSSSLCDCKKFTFKHIYRLNKLKLALTLHHR
jgi:hypothetical protein